MSIPCNSVVAVGGVGSKGDLGEQPTLDYPAQLGGLFGNAHVWFGHEPYGRHGKIF